MPMTIISMNEQDTERAAKLLAAKLEAPVTVAFTGGLGAGKTTFIRYLCRELGYAGYVTSPTFAIMNVYQAKTPLYHYDAYRLTSGEELLEVGYGELYENGISLIEWSENVSDALLGKVIRVDVGFSGDGRVITIEEDNL